MSVTLTARYPAWLLLSAGALVAALSHTLIDYHLGLFGQSMTMSLLQAANVLLKSIVYGWWGFMLAVAGSGSRAGFISTLVLNITMALLGNGLIAMVAVPPPSPAFPYQDLAHGASLMLGGLAALATWRAQRTMSERVPWGLPALTTTLIVAEFVVSSILALGIGRVA